MSQFGIGTPDAPSNSKPPLSRWLVVVIEELTSAWMPDIVAIVNMTRAMLARVGPVRHFLFIGYAIAVRTTGRHVRRRTSRVARPRGGPAGPGDGGDGFCRRRARAAPRAPRTAIAAPAATCRLVERCGTGSGMSRIARTMFSFDPRHEAMTIVAIVIRKPIANP